MTKLMGSGLKINYLNCRKLSVYFKTKLTPIELKDISSTMENLLFVQIPETMEYPIRELLDCALDDVAVLHKSLL
jgi:hypothetical protein